MIRELAWTLGTFQFKNPQYAYLRATMALSNSFWQAARVRTYSITTHSQGRQSHEK
jgi:hypothetical protein